LVDAFRKERVEAGWNKATKDIEAFFTGGRRRDREAGSK
jgi:hypothetical protein